MSSCLDAWLKYRPSVASAALSRVITAVPADPEKPQTISGLVSYIMSASLRASDRGERHKEQYILTDGSPQMVRLVI